MSERSLEPMKCYDCVIIGAGISGLTAALQIASHRPELTTCILEARDRIGGRCHTLRLPLQGDSCDGQETHCAVLDAGPAWFWPGQSALQSLVSALKLEIFEQFSEGFAIWHTDSGSRQMRNQMPSSFRIAGGTSRITEALSQQLEHLDNVRIIRSCLALQIKSADCSSTYKTANIGPNSGIEAACDERGWSIIETTTSPICARSVVVAVPPRVAAATVSFQPDLPQSLSNQMHLTPTWMANSAKFFAVYPEGPFWRDKGLNGEGFSGHGPLAEVHDACQPDMRIMGKTPGILFGFFRLDAATRAAQSVNKLKEDCVKQLVEMFGQQASNPSFTHIEDWSKQPETCTQQDIRSGVRGHPTYEELPSLMLVHGQAEAASSLDPRDVAGSRQDFDKGTYVVFCGSESCGDGNGGFMEGAVKSGMEAAEKITALCEKLRG